MLARRETTVPECMDFERFCSDLWHRGLLFGLIADQREVLGAGTTALLWRHVVALEADFSEAENSHVASMAAEAWRLMHRYLLPLPQLSAFGVGNDNVALFARCASRMQTLLKRRGGLTQSELVVQLSPKLQQLETLLPSRIVLTPSFAPYPAQQQLIARIADLGVTVETWQPEAGAAVQFLLPVHRYADESHETRAAITWAAERALQSDADSVAIVVPDLSSRRAEWLAALRAQLNPSLWTLDPETDRDRFNVSIGLGLSEYPHIAALLTILRSTHAEVETELLAQALTHPRWMRTGIALNRLREHERVMLDRGIDRSGLAAWSSVLSPSADVFLQPDAGHKQLRSAHATLIESLVAALSERASIPQSDLYQLEEAWAQMLQEWQLADRWLPPVTWHRAVQEIGQLAADSTFQPRAGRARIQVMGLLESAGAPFDAMWIAGLTDRVLPEAFKPHPMLPRVWQANHHVGLGSRDEVQRRAGALLVNWQALVGAIHVSFASQSDTGSERVSALFSQAPEVDCTVDAGTPREEMSTGLARVADEVLPETMSCRFGVAPASDRRPLSAGDIERQAHCPRKAVAAFMRLTEWPEHVIGISARVRGILVHEVMRSVGAARIRADDVGTPEPTAAALLEIAETAFDRVSHDEAQKRPRIPPAVWQLERSRLMPLIAEVIERDAARAGFEVMAVEQDVAANVLESEFKLRVDRLDDFVGANGESDRFGVVLDYKTGTVSRTDWFVDEDSARLAAPQLPLYVLALHAALPPEAPRVGAIGYVVISDDGVKFIGVGADPVFAVRQKSTGEPEWFDLMNTWRSQLRMLTSEIRTGVADVAPLKGIATCRNCGFASFCREPWSLAGSEEDDSGDKSPASSDEVAP